MVDEQDGQGYDGMAQVPNKDNELIVLYDKARAPYQSEIYALYLQVAKQPHSAAAKSDDGQGVTAAQNIPYFRGAYILIEAENFSTTTAAATTTATATTDLNGSVSTRAAGARSWSPKLWSVDSNYFAAAVINTFHSRRAYLHGPAAATAGTAIARFNVAMPGSYHVLVRYEATYEHETGFRKCGCSLSTFFRSLEDAGAPGVRLEQGGQALFTRVYGMLDNLKMWRTWGPAAQRDDPNIGPFRGRNSSQHCYGHLASVCKFPDGPMGLVWEG